MAFYIGIDGGGTKTSCVLTDSSLNVMHECTGGPSNFLILGTEVVAETILTLVDKCLQNAKLNYSDLQAVALGTAGAGRLTDADRMKEALISLCEAKGIKYNRFYVVSDALIALEGAFSGGHGSILVSGTGSIMYGKNSAGDFFRVGGYGRFIGDEGSGYSLGKKGLAAAARAFDGRGGKTVLTRLLTETFQITSAEELITAVYKYNFDISSAAQIVIEAAVQNDPACMKIIDEESDELLLHILTMADKINEPPLNIAFIGSLICNENMFSDILLTKIKDRAVKVHIKMPDHPPAVGAVILAKKYSEIQ